jgi:hypothetical protein
MNGAHVILQHFYPAVIPSHRRCQRIKIRLAFPKQIIRCETQAFAIGGIERGYSAVCRDDRHAPGTVPPGCLDR